MKLARLACLYLSTPQEKWKRFDINIGQYTIKSWQADIPKKTEKQRLLLSAEASLKYRPKIAKENVLVVPDKERSTLEAALHLVGNLISISEFRGRTMSSPTPCVVFIPENQKELDFLNKTNGLQFEANTNHDFKFSLQDIIMKTPLLDRQEGCEFIGVALSQESPVGQLHEYVRLFERAFALNAEYLVTALHSFLKKSDVVYTRNEIRNWIINLRDGSTHADKRNKLVYDPDVKKSIVRVRQTAYDVLFNKAKWHTPSTLRRKSYQAPMGLLEDNEPYVIEKNPISEGIVQVMDPYDVFPLDMNTVLNSMPKDSNWWFKNFGEDRSVKSKRFPFHVMKKNAKKTKFKKSKKSKTK